MYKNNLPDTSRRLGLILANGRGLRSVLAVGIVYALVACNDSQPSVATESVTGKVQAADALKPVTVKFPENTASADLVVENVANGDSQIVSSSTLALQTVRGVSQARFATDGTVPHYPQREGSVEAGRRALIEESYVNCGIPETAYRQLMASADVLPVEGRTDAADGLPFSVNVFTNDDDVSIVSNNCLTCHGTSLFGELVIGLGNEFLDFTGSATTQVELAGAFVQGDAETRAWELYADRIGAIAPYSRPHTVGVNPANNLTFALLAHRDAADNSWSDTPLLPLPPTDAAPVSVPPWWRMAKKPAMFNMGEGRLDHARIMMAASMLCTDSLAELEEIDRYAPDIRAYIASLSPPAYPFPVDQKLADAGRDVFETHCSHCHGQYSASETSYPARVVPIEVVQTDKTLIEFAHGPGVPYIDWYNRSYYGKLSTMAPGPGYMAPPLDGIWATAPFLHNGSVPTIDMVLNSQQRPDFWQHDVTDASDPESYDQTRLGWAHTVLDRGKADERDVRVYDTTLPGYANSGHLFGDHLSADQRRSVIEYLKTL
ncbi:MAG: hypothetical protein AB8B97_21525 [Granulosicoccus sp.]